MEMAPKAVLIGLPGSGKSTIGRRLARAMGLEMVDTDAMIEEQQGRSIPEIFATEGEPGFRRIEEQVIREALESHDGIPRWAAVRSPRRGFVTRWPATRSSTWRSAPPRGSAAPGQYRSTAAGRT